MTPRRHRLSPLRLLPALFFLLLAGVALLAARLSADSAGTTRYVSPTGSDGGANLCLNSAAPCATLARALLAAQLGDSIQLAPGEYYEAGLVIDKAIAIRGEAAATTRLDGDGGNTLLIVTGSGSLTVEGLTLQGGAGRRGGALQGQPGSTLTLRRVVLQNNTADQGGAIFADGAGLAIEDSRLAANSAGVGGAIYVSSGTLTMTRSIVESNEAGAGGGLYIGPAATATVRAVTLAANQAATVGGGVYVQSGALTMTNVVLSANRAASRGGGLVNDGGSAVSDYTTWLDNAAPAGAAIAAHAGGQTHLGTSILRGSSLCAGTITGIGILSDDSSCGVAAQPATGLDADGRPAYGSNAIDGGPFGPCLAAGALLSTDRRGEPRPAGDGGGAARCDVGAYEFQPRLTIRHVPNLSDGTRFGYSSDLGDFTLIAGERPRAVFEATPGSIRISQIQEPGWKLTGISCSGDADNGSLVDVDARGVTVDLDAGEIISCVFASRANRDTIGVSVRGPAGTDPAVVFDGGLGTFELRPVGHTDMRSGRLAAGIYSVHAAPPAGWRVAAIACAGDPDAGTTTNPAAGLAVVDLDTNEAIGCSFTLAPNAPPSLTIRHEVTPAGAAADASFVYSGDLGVFALQPGVQMTQTFAPSPGLYKLREILHPAWALSQLSCAGDLDSGSVLWPEEATAFIDLDEGEAITCFFGHVPATSGRGAILIEHAPTPADDTGFAFNGALGDFTLSSPVNPTRSFAQLTPGSYPVRQLTPAGWLLSDITCDGDTDNGTTLLPDEATAIIDLDEDEVIRCVYSAARPTQTGAITIIHDATPADETQFRYNGSLGGFNLRAPSRPSRAFIDLTPGSYMVGARPQAGWTLLGITCDGDSDGGSAISLPARQVDIDLDAGEAIVCRFSHVGPGVTLTPTPSPTPPPATATPPAGATVFVYLPIIR